MPPLTKLGGNKEIHIQVGSDLSGKMKLVDTTDQPWNPQVNELAKKGPEWVAIVDLLTDELNVHAPTTGDDPQKLYVPSGKHLHQNPDGSFFVA